MHDDTLALVKQLRDYYKNINDNTFFGAPGLGAAYREFVENLNSIIDNAERGKGNE